ncbi:Fe(2+)-trafficking protein [Chloracidobacterium sp. D]|uniref:Fe(2+)-trafficking protein n=1 Tax=Chloracidobacterium sp. D TaxID=2821536 RepID=UPI001B8DA808|nr:Fe(2+)-trafficking protein [Chloracidobacterium sp. D]QUV80729.1 Fe(2+)-trafficking protein [Chloracidobacterium sp. D]
MLDTLCVALKGTPRIVVQVLKEKGALSAAQLVAETGHPEKSVKLALGELEKARLIRREGETYAVACRETMAPMSRVPFNTDLGRKVHATACAECWKKWQAQQLVLMNHFGLNPLDPQAQKFLFGAMESFFFGDGTPPMMIDTTLQGKISHLE